MRDECWVLLIVRTVDLLHNSSCISYESTQIRAGSMFKLMPKKVKTKVSRV
jgi:hypothetical protein